MIGRAKLRIFIHYIKTESNLQKSKWDPPPPFIWDSFSSHSFFPSASFLVSSLLSLCLHMTPHPPLLSVFIHSSCRRFLCGSSVEAGWIIDEWHEGIGAPCWVLELSQTFTWARLCIVLNCQFKHLLLLYCLRVVLRLLNVVIFFSSLNFFHLAFFVAVCLSGCCLVQGGVQQQVYMVRVINRCHTLV